MRKRASRVTRAGCSARARARACARARSRRCFRKQAFRGWLHSDCVRTSALNSAPPRARARWYAAAVPPTTASSCGCLGRRPASATAGVRSSAPP
eukprot:14773350-Alexandrium_andersonii.AAC.1